MVTLYVCQNKLIHFTICSTHLDINILTLTIHFIVKSLNSSLIGWFHYLQSTLLTCPERLLSSPRSFSLQWDFRRKHNENRHHQQNIVREIPVIYIECYCCCSVVELEIYYDNNNNLSLSGKQVGTPQIPYGSKQGLGFHLVSWVRQLVVSGSLHTSVILWVPQYTHWTSR